MNTASDVVFTKHLRKILRNLKKLTSESLSCDKTSLMFILAGLIHVKNAWSALVKFEFLKFILFLKCTKGVV